MNKIAQKRLYILGQVKEFYLLSKKKEKFIPGKDKISYASRVFDEQELVNLVDASLEFWLTAGRFAGQFEKGLSKFLGAKYCSLVNSGSSANLLAISALTSHKLKEKRLKPGDEVITTACGFPTTLNPILQNNLTPVFVDINLGSYNIDAGKIERAINKKTKAIFIPHTLGNPADLEKILKVVKKYNLWFCEDNCDALGSKFKDRHTGTFGHISTCSFYPSHHITTGEGGAVFTDDPLLHQIINSFRDWGRDCWCEPGYDNTCGKRFLQRFGRLPFGYDHKYIFSHIGYNLKVTDMQAAIGLAQLQKLPQFIRLRKENFSFFYNLFKEYEDFILLPVWQKESAPSWFGFPILVRKSAPFSRAELVNYLEKHKIITRMLFGGNLTKQPAYLAIKCRKAGDLSSTDLVMNNLLWIGVYPGLNKEKLAYMEKVIHLFFARFYKGPRV